LLGKAGRDRPPEEQELGPDEADPVGPRAGGQLGLRDRPDVRLDEDPEPVAGNGCKDLVSALGTSPCP